MIVATLRIVASPENHQRILQTLRSVLGPTQVQPGCISCRVYDKDVEDEDALILLEEWKTQEDLDRHLRSDDYRRILAAMELASQAPEITFNTVSQTQGMEVIHAVRGA
ncbi:MAG: antibiotic biosynthesis monooxygenase [bacterium]|nr:antibiotic biosynthesis monooxygenase [bacterium]